MTSLRCRTTHKLKKVDLRFYRFLAPAGLLPFALLMVGAALEGGVHTPLPRVEASLLSALVDRWRPETHTFHMPFGEITVTLKDVAIITGLPIRGTPVVLHRPNRLQLFDYVQPRYNYVTIENKAFYCTRLY